MLLVANLLRMAHQTAQEYSAPVNTTGYGH